MHKITVQLNISPDAYLAHYQGDANQVSAISTDGRKIRFPTNILQPYVTRTGISGTFAITFSDQNKFLRIEKIA